MDLRERERAVHDPMSQHELDAGCGLAWGLDSRLGRGPEPASVEPGRDLESTAASLGMVRAGMLSRT